MFDIVKCGNKYLELDSIPKGSYSGYCMEDDDCVVEFLESYGITEIKQDEEFLRKHYNPLLTKQNLFLKNDDVCFEIPYLLLKHKEHLETIKEHKNDIVKEELKELFTYLIKYSFTKDLAFLNAVIEADFSFDVVITRHFHIAINSGEYNDRFLRLLVEILNGRLVNTPPLYKKYLDRKSADENMHSEIYSKIENNPKKKNVILLHLESISNEIYNNHIHTFPKLSELMSQSLVLNKYFSSATSSATSLIGLFFGNDFESDKFPIYTELYLDNCYQKNMYKILQENGYDVLGLSYNEYPGDEINDFNMWQVEKQNYEIRNTFEDFEERLREFILHSENPFALHVWNLMPQVGHSDFSTRRGRTVIERTDISYISLENTIETIIDALNERGIMDDTIIIGYGDHGDDKWTRALNKGFTHIIEPYLNVIKTPAFIYDSRIGKGIFNDIVSSVDIKKTTLFLLGIENDEDFPYQGINIFESRNKVVYSQNLLTNQRQDFTIFVDWVKRLNNFSDNDHRNKAFCAINDNYNMLVSDHGIEFFLHSSDPGNYNNLLDFFEIDEFGKIIRFNNHGAWRGHLRLLLMADDQILDIMKNYYTLRKALIDRINIKHSMIKTEEKNFLDINLFNKVRPRGYIWE